MADDSSAALGMGGLQFTKAPGIRMAKEDLYLSPKAVRIRYEFANDGSSDVDTLVAFPLPDIDTMEFSNSPIGTVGNDPVNFVNFTAKSDGKPVPVKVEQRAFVGNRDVTDQVKAAGIPVNIVIGDGYEKLSKLPAAKKRALEKAALAEDGGSPDNEFPKWTVRTRFYWMQHFPAGRTVVLEHSYQPVTGQTFFGTYDLDPKSDSGRQWIKDSCMDAGTVATLRKMLARNNPNDVNGGMLNIYSTDFILKTANNWKGGIGTLHLTLDKLKPDNVISLCWDGPLKKTGPTTFESTLANLQPNRDIRMVVLENPPPQQP